MSRYINYVCGMMCLPLSMLGGSSLPFADTIHNALTTVKPGNFKCVDIDPIAKSHSQRSVAQYVKYNAKEHTAKYVNQCMREGKMEMVVAGKTIIYKGTIAPYRHNKFGHGLTALWERVGHSNQAPEKLVCALTHSGYLKANTKSAILAGMHMLKPRYDGPGYKFKDIVTVDNSMKFIHDVVDVAMIVV